MFLLPLALYLQTENVADYFPLAAGDKWTYTCITNGIRSTVTYTAGAAIKINGQLSTPFAMSGDTPATLYYRVDNQAVDLVANDPSKPYEVPRPVLELSAPGDKWRCDYVDQDEPVNVDGHVVRRSSEVFLGKRQQIVEVHMKALLGASRHPVEIDQTLIYAKGVGLVKADIRQVAGPSVYNMELNIESFQQGASTGP